MGKSNSNWVRSKDSEGRGQLVNTETGEIKGVGFGMMEVSVIWDIKQLIEKHTGAAEALFFFIGIANKENTFNESQEELKKKSGFSMAKLQRSITILKKTNFIKVVKVGACNTYYINDRVFWQNANGDKLKMSNHTGAIKN
jgi:hypothetical protein